MLVRQRLPGSLGGRKLPTMPSNRETASKPGHEKMSRLAVNIEWFLLLALLALVGYFFVSHNGYVSPAGIQPYPY